jgi:general secretion pathway protein G
VVRRGFSLVELTVVILILGILGAATLSNIFNHYGAANENASRRSLQVVRDAIDLYRAENEGSLPGIDERTFKIAVAPYLKGPFPRCAAGNKNADVRVVSGDVKPLSASGNEGWAYNSRTGEFIINHSDLSSL